MTGGGEAARVRKRSSASGGGAAVHSGGGEMKRTTRSASKRAAMDDAPRAAFPAAGAQQAKKRAALANLSNHASLPSSRNSSPDVAKKRAALANLSNNANIPAARNSGAAAKGDPAAKAAVAAAVAAAKDKGSVAPSRNADVEAALAAARREKAAAAAPERASKGGSLASSKASPDHGDDQENVPPNRADLDSVSSSSHDAAAVAKASGVVPLPLPGSAESKELAAVQSDAAVIASLERKTLENLYISRSTKVALGPELGWSIASQLGQQQDPLLEKPDFTDIDVEDTDPQMCSIYAVDIYRHLRMQEVKRRPTTEFMEGLQQDINPSMRGILVDWLVEVADEYKLVPDTLYLTVSYIDRFLSNNVVSRQRLQLLGVSCMLIAAKYEEICAPQVEEFCYITDNTYHREEVLEMERRVLTNLHFELTTPTTKSFLRRFIRASQPGTPELQLEFLGNFLAELTLVEYSFIQYLPSMVAASAVFIARLTLYGDENPWTATLQHYTHYRASELRECVTEIHELQLNVKSCTLPAIREKYSQHKFKCVASLKSPSKIPEKCFEDRET